MRSCVIPILQMRTERSNLKLDSWPVQSLALNLGLWSSSGNMGRGRGPAVGEGFGALRAEPGPGGGAGVQREMCGWDGVGRGRRLSSRDPYLGRRSHIHAHLQTQTEARWVTSQFPHLSCVGGK